MATRAKLRKIAQYGINVGMGLPEFKDQLEEVLADCHNPTTRAKLRARIQRGTDASKFRGRPR